MGKLKLNSFGKRVVTALIMALLGFFIIYKGTPLVEVSALLIGILLAWEWSKMIPNKNQSFYMGSYVFSLVCCLAYASIWSLGILVLTTLFVWFKSKGEEKRKLLTLGVVYISVGVSSVVWLYQDGGALALLWLLLVVWGMDIGGYVVGCSLKGPKLMPKISPNKTYAGLFGGLLFAVLFSAGLVCVVDHVYRETMLGYVDYAEYMAELKSMYLTTSLLAMLFGFISQVGDFIESAIKRNVGVKDSSDLIPGHGGVFDRFDALVFAAPVAYASFVFWFM
ncbi:MAG: phosphatidate cytidylyltransferase [Alphaproteobacteria bacterium]|nr:phosphatidate cytidylyltransferase [Alphaproteobacteria bacterium]